ncbi:DNA methylase [bacterium]|nr:DNA methylase [bacterium]MBU1983424.1 DNA methylase [bacterium]
MAESQAHRFGQIIGEVLETALIPVFRQFARQHGIYLDMKGQRKCRDGLKCSWKDKYGNYHDLDFVFERGGTARKLGVPIAFIETAWRRYTKHSRNKAQEIQGAILPLADTYRNSAPLVGVVLAGVFTKGALVQLQSVGFKILYFPYDSVIEVFKKHGIAADFDEDTSEKEFQHKIQDYECLTNTQRTKLARELIATHESDVKYFIDALTTAVSRQVKRIIVLPLYGMHHEMKTIPEAIQFVEAYKQTKSLSDYIERYEIYVTFNNGNEVDGRFGDKASAIDFLRSYLPPMNKQRRFKQT